MTAFPDLIKDPADVALYAMDWSARLPGSVKIASATITVNGDVTVVDKTNYAGGVTVLSLQIAGGSGFGFTGDPQIGELSVVTVVATLSDSEILSRSFNVKVRAL